MAQFEPMNIGQILDRTFRLYRDNFSRFLAIVAIVQVPFWLLQTLLTIGPLSELQEGNFEAFRHNLLPFVGATAVTALLTLVAMQLANAALMKNISECYLGNQSSVGQSYRFILRKWLSLLAAALLVGLLVGLVILGPVMVIAIVTALSVASVGPHGLGGVALLGLGLLVTIPVTMFLGLLVWVCYCLTTPALVLENRGAIAGMGRSVQLTRGFRMRSMGLVLLVLLIGFFVNVVFGEVGTRIANLAFQNAKVGLFVGSLLQLVGQLLVAPISAAAYILLYYDLRIRKEGFDLEMLARSLGSTVPPTHASTPPPLPM